MKLISTGSRLRSASAALCITLLAATAARADDTEIFVNRASSAGMRPNILLIVDTSGSMDSLVSTGKSPYDPAVTYAGSCQSDRIYFRRGPGEPPACSTDDFVLATENTCREATTALGGEAGLWTGKALQWDGDRRRWRSLRGVEDRDDDDDNDDEVHVECEVDAGVHGENDASAGVWARNGSSNPWTTDASRKISWNTANVYTLYSANWLNWLYAPPDGAQVSRLDTVKSATATILNSVSSVNVGLMRFSSNAEGGMVTNAIADIGSNRAAVVETLELFEAANATPLSETLYEAGQYFTGRAVDFGLNSLGNGGAAFPSVAASRRIDSPDAYRSPIQFQCQRNFVILLTDGEPNEDDSADTRIEQLPGFASINPGGCGAAGQGRCLAEMARYLNQADLATGANMNGVQNAVTYTIGFGPDVSGSTFLAETAVAGGGDAFSADDIVGLTTALQEIVSDIGERSSTFTTPSVAVNAFSRLQSSNELYISVFEPTDTARWPGNLKKYGLENGRIVDVSGNDAIDPITGFFTDTAQSIWTVGPPDGKRVKVGGAASLLPAPAGRDVYTFIESADQRNLTSPANQFVTANAALSDALLGTSESEPTRIQLIEWARGVDVRDANGNGNTTEQNRFMGDPLHARPVLVTYSNAANEALVFVPTNDGFLHAVAADTGRELWSFVPQELLARLTSLYRDPGVATRDYGLDGDIRVLRFDVDQNGIIESNEGDRVFVYFGMRRGGRSYYALDVTNRTSPRVLWRIGESATTGADALPGIGETWSTPALARVRIGGVTQNPEEIVLIFGGGYDEGQEDFDFRTDTSGHRIYMVDAVTGKLLWYAGGPDGAGTPDLALAQMTHSIPARVTVIDTDGNGFADRMYTADTGGRVWRFDIWNDRSPAELVTGGVFANLGAAGQGTPALLDTRRFYYTPDVALIQRRGADPYYNLAIGSGYRGHPLHTETRNSFYSLRDKIPFTRLTQSAYDAFSPITEAQLTDITANITSTPIPRDTRGWKLDLSLNGPGEKVLAEAVTVNGTILFPSYEPQTAESDNPCVPANGLNRVYALRADTGRPALDFNDDASITDADAWTRLSQTGIAGEVSFALEARAGSGGGGGDGEGGGDDDLEAGPRDALGRRALCLVGVEVLRKCVGPGDVVRTFWQRTNTN
ncbi:MAG: pilus assembly protein [Gammaproteobacteria bacterium]